MWCQLQRRPIITLAEKVLVIYLNHKMAAFVYVLSLMARFSSALVSLMLTVVRTAQQAKAVRFLHLAFDTTGDSFLAADHHGNIYAFDLNRNRSDHSQNCFSFCFLFISLF